MQRAKFSTATGCPEVLLTKPTHFLPVDAQLPGLWSVWQARFGGNHSLTPEVSAAHEERHVTA